MSEHHRDRTSAAAGVDARRQLRVGINPRITAGIRYPIDGGIPGEWHLRIIRSGIPAGRVTGFHTALLDDDVIFITPDDIERPADLRLPDRRPGRPDPRAQVRRRRDRRRGGPHAADARVAASLVEVEYETSAGRLRRDGGHRRTGAQLVHAKHHTSESRLGLLRHATPGRHQRLPPLPHPHPRAAGPRRARWSVPTWTTPTTPSPTRSPTPT